jgi:hypothetical protein
MTDNAITSTTENQPNETAPVVTTEPTPTAQPVATQPTPAPQPEPQPEPTAEPAPTEAAEPQDVLEIPETYFLLHPENEPIILGEGRNLPSMHAWLVFVLVLLPLVGLFGWLAFGAYTRWMPLIPELSGGGVGPEGALANTLAWTGWAVLAGIAMLGLWGSALGVLWARRSLERRGQIAWGTVTEASGKRNSADNLRLTVVFRCKAPRRYAGELRPTLEGTLKRTRNDLKGQPLPPPGTPLPVLYLNPKNYEVL